MGGAGPDRRLAGRSRVSQRVGSLHRTLREAVADAIREMIRSGDLEPGDRLVEDRLAEQLGVSRNPVREAIRALEATGLVEVIPRRGAYVAALDPEQACELLELRALLESYAARLAARRRTPDDLDRLREVLDDGRRATEQGDIVSAARAHRDFHLAIETAARHPHLGPVVEPLRAQTELVFSVLVDHRGLLGWEQHVDIMRAIELGDEEAASRATERHMESVLDDLGRAGESVAAIPSTDGG